MQRRVPDLSKVKRWIGYAPQCGLREILQKVIDHERTALKA